MDYEKFFIVMKRKLRETANLVLTFILNCLSISSLSHLNRSRSDSVQFPFRAKMIKTNEAIFFPMGKVDSFMISKLHHS